MIDPYAKFMLRQDMSKDADAVFYEKLEQGAAKKRMPVWKAVVVAACILLLVPMTVWAAESIFRIGTVTRFNDVSYQEEPGAGLKIRYGDIQSYPISAFPEHLQVLSETKEFTFDSWEDAKQFFGIPILLNTVFTDENTHRVTDRYWSDAPAGAHCHGYCLVEDGQLYYGTFRAVYERNNITVAVSAEVTAEHPTQTGDRLREYHGIHIEYAEKWDPQVITNTVTTKGGIPVTILSIGIGETNEYIALFAVNDISYQVRSAGMKGRWDNNAVYSAILEVLDGFVIE